MHRRWFHYIILAIGILILAVTAGCNQSTSGSLTDRQETEKPEPTVAVSDITPKALTLSDLPAVHTGWTSFTNGNEVSDIACDSNGDLWAVGSGGAVIWNVDKGTYVKLTSEYGLCSNQLSAVAVSPDGAVWLASLDNGVCCFDGQTFTTYTEEDGLPSNVVLDFAIAPDGSVWAATQMGAASFNGEGWTAYSDGLGEDIVTTVAADHKGGIWFGTHFLGIFKFEDGIWVQFNVENAGVNGVITDIACAPDGTVWAASATGGLYHFTGGKPSTIPLGDMPFSGFGCIAFDEGGALWAAQGQIITRYMNGEFELYAPPEGVSDRGEVSAITVSPQGTVWCGGFDIGMSGLRGGEWQTLSTDDWLPDNSVLKVKRMDDGTLWLLTQTAVTCYDGTNAQSWQVTREPLDIETGLDGSIWVSIRMGGLYRYDGSDWAFMGPGTQLPLGGFSEDVSVDIQPTKSLDGDWNVSYTQIMFDQSGVLWALKDNGDVQYLDDNTWSAGDLPAQGIMGFAQSASGIYWISTPDGLNSSQDAQNWTAYPAIVDDRNNQYDYGSLYIAPDETCWVGGLSGVASQTVSGQTVYYKRGEGIPDNEVVCITGDGNEIWIGTQNLWTMTDGKGACRYNGDWQTFSASDGLAGNAVMAIEAAPDAVWFATLGGLSRLSR